MPTNYIYRFVASNLKGDITYDLHLKAAYQNSIMRKDYAGRCFFVLMKKSEPHDPLVDS
jgi:hypothetical protein